MVGVWTRKSVKILVFSRVSSSLSSLSLSSFSFMASLLRAKNRPSLKSLGIVPGRVVHNFEVLAVTPLPDFDFQVASFQHVKTKAQYIHVDTSDTNNAFNITCKCVWSRCY